ncbi:hydroxyacid dehydrogenase [bacterium]|mgnify:CR=1 FL=1|nr:hydroxyacid dehydrogenase [bacterium]|tara:strand:+ start:10623 stop:11636 length:1014 start_codon:yes stop_codon:yes gene_type:complete
MKVAYFNVKDSDREYFTLNQIEGITIDLIDGVLNDESIPEDASEYDAISTFVNSRVSKKVIEAFPNVKYITTRSTGFDHVDIATAKEKGIVVSNVPSYGENTVAEHTFALLLTLSKRIYESYDRLREKGIFSPEDMTGFDLRGKTLGVIGMGTIGKNVIKIAKGFDMHIIASDTNPDLKCAEEFNVECKSFEEVLALADIVTLHIPHNDSTHHLLNKETMAKMKDGAVLLNTSRGPIVKTEALVEALKSGKLAGAGLDVLEEEGVIRDELEFLATGHPKGESLKILLANHAFIDLPNVIVTPHNAFNTKEALQRIVDTTVENLKSFKEGKPINVVNK